MTFRPLLLLSFFWAGCGGMAPNSTPDASSVATPFIATDEDFAHYADWTAFVVAPSALSDVAYPNGARHIFLNRRPPRGATVYPVGTIFVKAIEPDATPTDWEMFGLAKRGGDYNLAGAVGWEFFRLRINASGAIGIVSRGLAPTDNGPDAGIPDGGNDYTGAGGNSPCNICHGQSFANNDYTINDELAPSATAE